MENANIDITKKAPDEPQKCFKNTIKKVLFYTVQWTWGLPVNLFGAIIFWFCTKVKKRNWQRFGICRGIRAVYPLVFTYL